MLSLGFPPHLFRSPVYVHLQTNTHVKVKANKHDSGGVPTSLSYHVLRRSGLRCSRRKSQLFLDEVPFLGHIIRPGQMLPDLAKIARVEQFPLPANSHQLHSFLGLVNYLRDFVPNLANHTAVLHAALAPSSTAEKAYYEAMKMHKGHLPDGWTGWTWSFGPAEQAAF